MGLMPAQFTTLNTRKRKKIKFKSAEHKKRYLEFQESQKILKEKYRNAKKPFESIQPTYSLDIPSWRKSTDIPSLDSSIGSATKPINNEKVYTGDNMLGIGQLHKSNSVPVFRKEDAEDQAKMRRG